jgi:hypothetical protein
MLDHLYPMHSEASSPPPDRKSRLYYAACARRVWDRLPWVCRTLVEFAEDAADRRNGDRGLRELVCGIAERLVGSCGSDPDVVAEEVAATGSVLDTVLYHELDLRKPVPPDVIPEDWDGLVQLVYAAYAHDTSWHRQVPAVLHSAELIREVFGSPFPPLAQQRFRPAWRTSDAVELARQMYEGRDFTNMPILCDALQDAGCGDQRIIDHCHDPRTAHVRGCWVVDLVLGKK